MTQTFDLDGHGFPASERFVPALARLTAQAPAGPSSRWNVVADELDRTLAPHVDDGGLTFPTQTWLVTAKRSVR